MCLIIFVQELAIIFVVIYLYVLIVVNQYPLFLVGVKKYYENNEYIKNGA